MSDATSRNKGLFFPITCFARWGNIRINVLPSTTERHDVILFERYARNTAVCAAMQKIYLNGIPLIRSEIEIVRRKNAAFCNFLIEYFLAASCFQIHSFVSGLGSFRLRSVSVAPARLFSAFRSVAKLLHGAPSFGNIVPLPPFRLLYFHGSLATVFHSRKLTVGSPNVGQLNNIRAFFAWLTDLSRRMIRRWFLSDIKLRDGF